MHHLNISSLIYGFALVRPQCTWASDETRAMNLGTDLATEGARG